MNKKYKKTLFIFRRDLRLQDNTGLIAALKVSRSVVPAFVFDTQQTNKKKNDYFSLAAFQFMCSSLVELDAVLKKCGSRLYFFIGHPTDVVTTLIRKDGIDAVFLNNDYTPFSRRRDAGIASVCEKNNITFFGHNDIALSPIQDIVTKQGGVYSVFTPFKNNATSFLVSKVKRNNFSHYFSGRLKTKHVGVKKIPWVGQKNNQMFRAGRVAGLQLLRNDEYLKNYTKDRDFPAKIGTSHLSVHHKFGTISIRETYWRAMNFSGNTEQFLSQLYWRDFYYYIAYHFPHVFGKPFLSWGEEIQWINNKKDFRAWCSGKTGVPIVDAGMRELNKTGWMHNRVRMIVASYLTKNLLIDWRWGEKYFARHLVDYDPAQNNGGWQWSASTGADPRPLRIFNPYLQAKRYDPAAVYIKRWVPELKPVSPAKLTDGKTQDFSSFVFNYPKPVVGQRDSYHRAIKTYKEAKNS